MTPGAYQFTTVQTSAGAAGSGKCAANAGGAWSVVGDTTTTMMWIDGVSPKAVFEALLPAVVALLIFGIPAARWQQNYSPILQHSHAHTKIDWGRIAIVSLVLWTTMFTMGRLIAYWD